MSLRYKLQKDGDRNIYSSLTTEDEKILENIKSESTLTKSSQYRVGKFTSSNGIAYVITSKRDLIKSSRMFKQIGQALLNSIDIVSQTIDKVNSDHQKNIRRIVHNLTSLNAHNIQDIYAFIPQEYEIKNIRSRFKSAEKIVQADTKEAAKTLVRVARNNSAMKVELSVFSRLLGENPELKPSSHKIHKVLMNVFYVFFPDFTDKYVEVNFEKCTKAVHVDYESLHVALYHIVENLTKYVKDSSGIDVSFNERDDHIEIKITIFSLAILPEELELIFQEGFSGHFAKKLNKAGYGIGMHRAKSLIQHNQGKIKFIIDPGSSKVIDGNEYQKQVISISLPRHKKG